MSRERAILVAYVVVGMVTFGYSYNADYQTPKSPFVAAEELNGARAVAAGMIWPLYWMVQAFRSHRQQVTPGSTSEAP